MKMSLVFKTNSVLEQEYATKGELHYGLHVSYARIAQAIRDEKLAIYLVDGKVQLRVEEVANLFFPPRKSLFD
jgi:pyruvate kinase